MNLYPDLKLVLQNSNSTTEKKLNENFIEISIKAQISKANTRTPFIRLISEHRYPDKNSTQSNFKSREEKRKGQK